MPFDLPPDTPWYVVTAILALYGCWKLVEPYVRARVKNAAEESTAISENRINRIELEQRRQLAQAATEQAMLSHLGNLVNKFGELAEAFVDSNKNDAQERAAWLTALEQQAVGFQTLQTSIEALPERIAEKLANVQKENESERS